MRGSRVRLLGLCLLATLTFMHGRPSLAQNIAPELIERARAEKELVWYTTLLVAQAVRPIADAFERNYGIRIRHSRANGAEIATRIINEARAGAVQADVFDGTQTIFPLLDAGLVGRYVPAGAAAFPPEFRDAAGYWVAANLFFQVPAYNTRLVKREDAPRTLDDLLHPRWRGRIAWPDNRSVNGPPGFIAGVFAAKGQEKGLEYLRALARQKPVAIPAVQRVVLDQVISEEYPLALMTFNHHSAISQKQGAPVEWIRMEPVIGTFNYLSMTEGAPHPNAARLFIEFLTSIEGQRILESAGYLPAHPDVPSSSPELKPDTGHFKPYFITVELHQKHYAEWDRLFMEMLR